MIKKLFSKDYWIVKRSGLFDDGYYLRTYPDIRDADIDPILHYCAYGWREGRNPSSRFDTSFYLATYPDVRDAVVNPLVHYVRYGKMEGRRPLQNSEQINQKESYFARRKNTVKKILTLIGNNPKLIAKFMTEVKANGLKYAIGKMQGKMHKEFVLFAVSPIFAPQIIDAGHIEKREVVVFEKFDKPKVSIVIPVYNNYDITYNCLLSIYNNTKDVEYEIIVADDNSDDETVNIEKYFQNIKVIRDGINRRFLKNCNNAAKYAIGEHILFLNNDTQVQEGWLSSLVGLMESDGKIGMVGSKLVYPDGRLQEAGGIIWQDASGWNYGRLDDPTKPEYNYVKEVDYISGASIMIRKSLWNDIGGFDERYAPAYYEDSDLAFEVRRHGYKVAYQPKSVVVHFEGVSHGTDLTQGMKRYQVLNKEKFVEKWHDVLMQEHLPSGKDPFLARDRSKGKRHILVIDHYVPHYDQDAGSRTMWQYINLFKDIGYQITFLGDNFYPHEPYTSELQQLGVEILVGKYIHENIKRWFVQDTKYFDFVFLSRPHIAIKYMALIKQNSLAKTIYYGHDLHHVSLMRKYKVTNDVKLLKEMEQIKKVELELFQLADIVFMLNNEEIEFINNYTNAKKAKMLKCFFYKKLPLGNKTAFGNRDNDILFVGGFAHSPNVDAVLWYVNSVWPNVEREHKHCKFIIAGSKPPEEILKLQSDRVIVKGYVSDEELDDLYTSCKVVVVPLRYGAGVKGKVVEAISHGIPVVTTSTGTEGLPDISDAVVCCNDEFQFGREILCLLEEGELWERQANKALNYAEKHFSYNVAKNELQEILDDK